MASRPDAVISVTARFVTFTTLLATRRGHIRCLKYAVENGCALHPKLLREDADVPTQMECFKYALELGLEVDDDAVLTACRNISVTRLRLLIEAYQEQTKRRKRRREGDANNMIVERGTSFIGAVCANVASETAGGGNYSASISSESAVAVGVREPLRT